ncbi:Protein piccolo [Actinoplanes sp. SE50]|uniref:hypothetical protein n=1 Tax=unclassified Actinoplanes TaxID=2626549 RepID=UPI00023EC587|nr:MULTISPECIES: hypothetical protein [unclassified Actinoplanes]AEV81946.1 Protein piccolo [Actinoplanes sp. SE50/110]ATO80346.1 Protein piccolo [Actinoplanes sp. SE50]SLL97752.1 Protein piccolo [Actinoplanes sp. SE50/110]
MTSAPPEGKPIGQYLTPLRDLAAYVLVGAPAVFLLATVLNLFGDGFGARAAASFGGFISLETIGMPLAAVLLALGIKPVHPRARLITLAAVIEYAVMAFFGVIFGLLFGVINIASYDAGAAFSALLARVAWLAVFGVAGYAVLQIWRGVYMVPKPQMPPGVYGQPQSYGQPYGQPAAYPASGIYGQAPSYPPGTYGQPPQPQPPHAQPVPPPAPPVVSRTQPPVASQAQPPAWNQPPVVAPPVAPPPLAEPTQVVPRGEPEPIDRTSVLPEERPGFGPADADPPRQ